MRELPTGASYAERYYKKGDVRDTERRDKMLEMYADQSILAIAEHFGLTKQRVHQILVTDPRFRSRHRSNRKYRYRRPR